ncbi:FAD binding domain-containing protein [Pigmentiphaga soli]|uniref:FAD binding domain-containing protein n=1 Tax=Pigmentiphaga soli TaxID=1007095 RepID=A0ABP8HJ68_9BURK
MKAARFDYLRPADRFEAVRLLAQTGGLGKIVAGSQSLGPMLNMRLAQPSALIDVRVLDELALAREEDDAIVLGACITHARIEDGLVPDPSRGLLPFVAGGIAYRAVRNRGTLGGSLAHADPAADWINAMPLLDAECLLQGPGGERSVAAADWMQAAFTTALGEDEILTGVRLPRLSPAARWSYIKFNRKAGEFAEAIAAVVDDPRRGLCRAVIGALDGPPHVVADARPLLGGDAEAAARRELAAAGLEPDTYEYRLHAVALSRAVQALGSQP